MQMVPIESMDSRRLWEAGDLCRRKTASDVDLNRNWDFEWKQEVVSSKICLHHKWISRNLNDG